MKKRKNASFKKKIPAHQRIPREHGKLTYTAKQLYDLIYWCSIRGCYAGNLKLASMLTCSTRAIQYARKQLDTEQLIITRVNRGMTTQMWSRYHLAVMRSRTLLDGTKSSFDNPYFGTIDVTKGCKFVTPQGVQKPHLGGAKFAPKLSIPFLSEANKNGNGNMGNATLKKPAKPSQSQGEQIPLKPPELHGYAGWFREAAKDSCGNAVDPLDLMDPKIKSFAKMAFKKKYNAVIDNGQKVEVAIIAANIEGIKVQSRLLHQNI